MTPRKSCPQAPFKSFEIWRYFDFEAEINREGRNNMF